MNNLFVYELMPIQQTINNEKFWEPLSLSAVKQNTLHSFIEGMVRHPVKQRLNQVKFIGQSGKPWIMVFKTDKPVQQQFISLFEDSEANFYAIVCKSPEVKPGFFEAEVLNVYKSKYTRKSKRHVAEGLGFRLREIKVKSEEFEPEKVKAKIEILFKSYSRFLAQNFSDYEIAFYPRYSDDELDQVLQKVKSTLGAVWLADTSNPDSYNQEFELQVDTEEIHFEKYNQLVEADIFKLIQRYQRRMISNELIVPILYQRPGGPSENLGFIRLRNLDLEKISIEKAIHGVVQTTTAIITALKNSNYKTLSESFEIVDISMDGLCILVQTEETLKMLLEMKRFKASLILPARERPLSTQVKTIHAQRGKYGFYLGVKLVDLSGSTGSDSDSESAWIALRKGIRDLELKN